MKKLRSKKFIITSVLCASVLSISLLAYSYSNNIPKTLDSNEIVQYKTAEIEVPTAFSNNTSSIDDYQIMVGEFKIAENTAKSNGNTEYTVAENKYGTFKAESVNGKIKKIKYSNCDTSKKYLIKGTAEFLKLNITFNGYFLVDETLSGNKKGQVLMYKGKLNLPNGDKFNGTLSSGKYYSSGTYTWKNGASYKGKYTTSNKLGSSSLPQNNDDEYGYFYFDSSKNNYLYVRFVNSVPRSTGYYITNGKKYTVTFDENGKCISTKNTSAYSFY